MIKFALAGNPNSGKTTLFNCLTGSTAHVGNWPGVTVDKREGDYKKCAEPISVVDLPGIYSLSPYTPEEVVSRNFILDDAPDCVINIVDVTNLERNLYLTTQILEMDVPVVVALNMMDVLEKRGDSIDEQELERRLGVPVVKVSALMEEGLDNLMATAYAESKKKRNAVTVLAESKVAPLIAKVRAELIEQKVGHPLFHAVKIVEGDGIECEMHALSNATVEEFKKDFDDELFGTDFEALIADARYKYIAEKFSPILKKSQPDFVDTKSDKADRILTHKWFGIPIFLMILFAVFHITFAEEFLLSGLWGLPTLEELGLTVLGEPKSFAVALLACFYDGFIYSPGVILFNLTGLLTDTVFSWLVTGLENAGASEWVLSFVGDGVLSGLGSVLSFVPQILTLLLLLSVLEDTGYMARVAFILDRLFRRYGISGRAFIPMIMGFGCSIPAMVNTRTLLDERERTLTIRTIPFFSCGAKLPILVAVAGAVGYMTGLGDGSIISFSMYVIGMAVAFISIIVMRETTQRGDITPFIMELPPYHLPSGKALMIHLWDKTKHYLEKVFTVILASTIVVWFLSNFGWNFKMVDVNDSILSSIGKILQPIFTPLGFGSQLNDKGWVFIVAAITGLIAKEEVIATFGTLSAVFVGLVAPELGVEGATDVMVMTLGTGITWQALVAFIVFNMTTIPCFAAVAAAKGEIQKGKFKWTILFWIITSYVASSIVYTVLSWWWTMFVWLAFAGFVTVGIMTWKEKQAKK